LVCMWSSQILFAQANPQINYQGKLTTPAGVAVANNGYDMTFRLYTSVSGGAAIWTETLTGANQVDVTNGLFSVMLGSTTPLTSVDFDQPLYLGVEVDSDGEMTPRKAFGTVPAAFVAQSLSSSAADNFLSATAADTMAANTTDTLLTINQSGTGDILNLLDDGTEVFTVADGGNVGVGTTTANAKLTVAGEINIADGAAGLSLLGQRILYASSTNNSLAIGIDALSSATSSVQRNVAIGTRALTDLTGGSNNVAIGHDSLADTTTGGNNLGLGYRALRRNTIGNFNSAFGSFALSSNIDGRDNSAFGYGVLLENEDGDDNVGIGRYALRNNTSGSDNIGIGTNVGDNLTAGSRNIIIGGSLDFQDATTSNSLNIGNLLFGTNLDGTGTTLSSGNIGIGTASPNAKLTVTGEINIDDPANGFSFMGTRMLYGSTTNDSYTFGEGAGGSLSTSGIRNIAIGRNALTSVVGGIDNIAIGSDALRDVTSGGNIAIGSFALQVANNDYSNVSIGGNSFQRLTEGFQNVAIGTSAGRNFSTTTNSVIVGFRAAGNNAAGGSNAFSMTVVGTRAGENLETFGNFNTLIGFQAGDEITTGSRNVIIGHDIDTQSNTASNQLSIGNLIFGDGVDGTGTTTSTGNVGIGTSTLNARLRVAGDIRVGDDGTNGCIENNGGGVLSGTCTSDRSLKTNIEPLSDTSVSILENLVALEPVTYHWNEIARDKYAKGTEFSNTGLIAQNVEAQFPELVSENQDGYKQVDFTSLPYYIIEAMRELWRVVTGNQAKINTLEQRIIQLEQNNELQPDSEYTVSTPDKIEDKKGQSETNNVESEEQTSEIVQTPEVTATTSESIVDGGVAESVAASPDSATSTAEVVVEEVVNQTMQEEEFVVANDAEFGSTDLEPAETEQLSTEN